MHKLPLILFLVFSSFTSLAQKKKDRYLDGCLEGCWEVSFIVIPEEKSSIQFIKGAALKEKFEKVVDSGAYQVKDRVEMFEVVLNKYDFYLVEVIEDISYQVFYEDIKGKGDLLMVCLWQGDEVNKAKAKRIYQEVMKEYRSLGEH